MNSTNDGLLIRCDHEGIIRRIYFNNIDETIDGSTGRLFAELFVSEEIEKALQFLMEIKKHYATFGWGMLLRSDLTQHAISFGGAIIENAMMIFGSESKIDFTEFIAKIMALNNEQVNTIRSLEKERQNVDIEVLRTSSRSFDEISKLNNELVNTRRELEKRNSELQSANTLKNLFLGMAAHDLRHPLGVVANICEIMEDDKANLTDEQVAYISDIKIFSRSMLHMVNELLDISAMESGKQLLVPKSVDMVPFVNQIIKTHANIALRKNILLTYQSALPELPVLCDAEKMEQVISNLITNAIKYSSLNQGVVVELVKNKSEAVLSVKDSGPGIPQHELDHLFKPFQKASSKTIDGERSTGLGLYIVKRIIEAHNGRVWAESKVGCGTTFYVALPVE